MATRAERISVLMASGAARPLRFGMVGGVTFALQLILFVSCKALGLGSILAYAVALALAVQFNFIVSQLIVWHDRPSAVFSRHFWRRWVTFHWCTSLSLVLNMGAFAIAQMFIPDLAATVVGVAASTAVKFLSLDKFAFRPAPPLT